LAYQEDIAGYRGPRQLLNPVTRFSVAAGKSSLFDVELVGVRRSHAARVPEQIQQDGNRRSLMEFYAAINT
jgi:hypothetical protein